MITRRGRAGLLLMALLAALAAAGCDSGDDSSDSSKPADPAAGLSKEPVTITYWTTFAGDEFKLFKKTIAAFEKKYPWVTVKATPGIDDSAKVLAAINGGNPPDLWNYYTPEPVQAFCSNGALEPLDTYVEKTGLDLGRYSDFWVDRLKTDDKLCALPWLADSYGLYYNTDLFKQAGLREPPKTASELLAAAKKLTKFNGDGTIKVAGFVPLWNWYENWSASWSAAWGAAWLTDDGTPAIGSDSRWAEMFKWQKELIDFYGYDKIQKFISASPDEFSASNDFHTGRVAMMMDGEWRVAFIDRSKKDVPYATAPFPAPDSEPDRYGGGLIYSNILAIPEGAEHPDEAWLLAHYLAADEPSQVDLADALKVLPPLVSATDSPAMRKDPKFRVFLDIYSSPNSTSPPTGPEGTDWQAPIDSFAGKWQAGKISDLESGLAETQERMEALLEQSKASQAP